MLDSLDEVEVSARGAVVVTAAARLVRMHFMRSTSFCMRVLYITGFRKLFGQSAAWWSWKKLRHLMHPSFSFKSFHSESSSFGHCLRGAEAADKKGAEAVLLLFGTWLDEGSLKLFI